MALKNGFSTRLTEEQMAKVSAYAAERGISRAAAIRRMLARLFEPPAPH